MRANNRLPGPPFPTLHRQKWHNGVESEHRENYFRQSDFRQDGTKVTEGRERIMIIDLSANEWQALAAAIAGDARFQHVKPQHPTRGGRLELSAELADIGRDLCEDRLLALGFDANYKPNAQGELLEALIDKLFTG
jgi:hypothetical protein